MTLFDWIESIQTLFEVQTHEGYIWFNLYISSCWIESYMMLYYSGGVTELWQTQKNTKKLELWVGRLFIHRIHYGRIQCHSTTNWWLWDILKECFPNEEVVTVWSADALCDILGTRLTTIVGDKASMKVVVDWLHTWRQAESNSRARNKETDYLVAYRNRNEAWNYYRLCTIRFDNQGDYRERIRNLPTILLIINRTYAMSKVMWRQY